MLVGEVLQLSAVKSTEVVSSGERVFLSCTFSNRANSVGILRGLANTRLGISNDDGSLDRGSYSFSSDPVVFVSLFGFVGVIVVFMVRALGGGDRFLTSIPLYRLFASSGSFISFFIGMNPAPLLHTSLLPSNYTPTPTLNPPNQIQPGRFLSL